MQENTQTPQQNNSMKYALPLVGIIVIGVLGYALMRPTATEAPTPTTAPTTSESTTPAATTETSEPTGELYKDGTYTVVGNYTSPGGQEELGVTITIAEGIVTDSEVEVLATRPISKERQEDFAANYKNQIIGKNIADLELGKVSGSSLTPKGFNDALEKIKTEAQS